METRILIADEDKAVRRMIARVLDVAGFWAVQAANWSELQAQLETAEMSLLLLDLELLEGGSELIRARAKRLFASVPVIGMTALPHQHQTARRWGLNFLMEKPLDLTLLLCWVQELLARSQTIDAPPAAEGDAVHRLLENRTTAVEPDSVPDGHSTIAERFIGGYVASQPSAARSARNHPDK